MALPFLTAKSVEPIPEIEAASLRSDRFRLERETDWKRLESIVRRMESGWLRRMPDEDVIALPALYRTAASSLAVARETTLDAATLAYLEALVQRAWFQVYAPRIGLGGWLRRFLGGEWSASVRAIWLDICIAFAVMVVGALVGWLLVARDPDNYFMLVSSDMAQGRVPGADAETLRQSIGGVTEGGGGDMSVFASALFVNNATVSIFAFALGFAFGIPSVLLLIYNLATLGAMLWVFAEAGMATDFVAWLTIHGTTELFAVLLAGAAGLHIGRTMAFPGNSSIMAAAARSGRRSAQVMAGVVLMLVVAALLEGFARQIVTASVMRFAIGAAMLVFWITYFLFAGRRKRLAAKRVTAG